MSDLEVLEGLGSLDTISIKNGNNIMAFSEGKKSIERNDGDEILEIVKDRIPIKNGNDIMAFSEGKKTIEIKIKKPRTQKQIDAFAKVQLIRQENRDLRKDTKTTAEKEQKEILDKKIVAKAIALKKKQIKMEKMLVIVPDEEEEDDAVIERVEKPKAVRKAVKKVVVQEDDYHDEPASNQFKFI